jgi:ribose 5-phosphate isomerase A
MSNPTQDPAHAAKVRAAEAALAHIEPWLDQNTILGIGTGSTTRCFIELLGQRDKKIAGAVSSSVDSQQHLEQADIPCLDLNSTGQLEFYIDGADEFDPHLNLIKGGGGALTREKIIAACAKQFICIVDQSKQVEILGKFPLPIEVIPMARSYVGRCVVALGGNPVLRDGATTDNGNIIIDIHGLSINEPLALENKLNGIAGVVCVGLFAHRGADKVIMATPEETKVIKKPV